MEVGARNDHGIFDTTTRAIQLTEEALGHVSRMAVEAIHLGLEATSHIEAAERDMRSALRQLVLAERQARARHALQFDGGERSDAPIADVLSGPNAGGLPSSS